MGDFLRGLIMRTESEETGKCRREERRGFGEGRTVGERGTESIPLH